MQPFQTPKPKKQAPKIRGEVLDLETLLDFATVSASDIASAAEWWDEHASAEWVGALDSEPIKKVRL
jgi:hypothetical protein